MKYLKLCGYYLLFLILIAFVCSILNLIGVNSTITNLLIFISNAVLFFYSGFKNGITSKEKGYLAGIKISLLLLMILLVINLITTRYIFHISTMVYYLILILIGIAGGMIGINKKKESN